MESRKTDESVVQEAEVSNAISCYQNDDQVWSQLA